MWVPLCVFSVMLHCSVSAYYHPNNYAAAETELRAHVGTAVDLPCIVDENQCGKLHSVKWYKDAKRVYILSQGGERRAEAGAATERMSVELTNNGEALLKIDPVKPEDEATYLCEITYLEVIDNCDVVQIVKLRTLKKPELVRILDDNGRELTNGTILGPMQEGSEIDLTCEAIGGKPVPKVQWYNDTVRIKRAEYTMEENDGNSTGKSLLQLTLSRGDLLKRFECRVESDALDEPIISWIKIDVHVRPTRATLTGVQNHVVEGTNVLLYCDVPGARPAATVRWTNGSVDITKDSFLDTERENFELRTDVIEMPDGTFNTKGTLAFKATHHENGITIYCYAENKLMDDNGEPELSSSIILDVRYPPVINLFPLNITVNESTYLSEGNSVLLKCFYFANPAELKNIVWSKDGKNLTLNDIKKYKGGTIDKTHVYIRNVVREDMGEYTCSLENEVGFETSEDSIYLNVQYPPDVEVVIEPSHPIKSTSKSTVLLQCNVTSGNPSTLEKVRWLLDGEPMKELPECNYTSYDENGVGEGNGGPFCGLDPSIMSLEMVDETFAGNYTCQGKTLAGWGNQSEPKELIVYYPPSKAKLRYYPSEVVKGGSVTLECIIDNPGRPDNLTFIWHRGVHHLADVTTANFTISPVRLETRSNFTCVAENEGGKSASDVIFISVNAPPAFIQKLPSYQGVLYNSRHINLTCIVECYPECSIIWKKDGIILNTGNNSLYSVVTTKVPPDVTKNDFDSINSTLIWNMDRWPGKVLNKSSPDSHYTCQSMTNRIGAGVNSTIEIAVDYPVLDQSVMPSNSHHRYATFKISPMKTCCVYVIRVWTNPGLIQDSVRENGYYLLGMSSTHERTCTKSGRYSRRTFRCPNPPEDVHVSQESINVIEHQPPSSVKCFGKGHPALNFQWRRSNTSELISTKNELNLKAMTRSEDGPYICEAYNKHGIEQAIVSFNVQFAPECSISVVEKDSGKALRCIVRAKPEEVKFTWRALEYNETFLVTSNIKNAELESYLFLDSSVDTVRTYYCSANNSVGTSTPCEMDVVGTYVWWNNKMIIIIASIIAIVIIVIIICIIIIILCRRKRADTKYNNPLEMEERENPDGNCGNITDLSKWPLQPGVLVQVNKMNGVSISQLSPRMSPFKTTSVSSARTYLKYKRNKSKVYARLERLKELLGINRNPHHVPMGIKEGETGVVTFKKVNPSIPVSRSEVVTSRKRKKPGDAPNPSSVEDKARLGAAPPAGGIADPLSDPDKGFYENLPFHGMQNPPNKPISVIAPFTQGKSAQSFTSSSKSLLPPSLKMLTPSLGTHSIQNGQNKIIKRNQSFHGFQNNPTPLTNVPPYFPLTGTVNTAYLNSYPSHQFKNIPGFYNQNLSNPYIPKIFSQLPSNFAQTSGFNTISGIPIRINYNDVHKVRSNGNLATGSGVQTNFTRCTNSVAPQRNRIVGRNEEQYEIRRTASGINLPGRNNANGCRASKMVSRKSYHNRRPTEKRFSSLEVKKHKCYSPTFYSVRCKKNPKRRSVMFALPNHCFGDVSEFATKSDTAEKRNEEEENPLEKPISEKPTDIDQNECFQNLTDSIQIFEQSLENSSKDTNEVPVPAPRSRKQKKSEVVYANVSPGIQSTNSDISNSSTEVEESDKTEISVIEVQIHASNNFNSNGDPTNVKDLLSGIKTENKEKNCTDVIDGINDRNTENVEKDSTSKIKNLGESGINKLENAPKPIPVSPKHNPSKPIISPHALKNSPILKVSPNFIKPKTESPKGALSQQIKAKIKAPPAQNPAVDNFKKSIPEDLKDDDKTKEPFPEIPQMPILNTQIKWSPNIANFNGQNAFYTLTTPHFKQLNTVVPPRYSATIPHQKHAKLMPKSLFQEQLPKSKSFSSKSKQKKHHFQIPLQKCHSFKFQTAESYFQPIKNIHEENLMRNGYVSDYPESSTRHGRHHKRDKPKQKTKGPLVLRRPSDYQENIHFQENIQNSVQLQYPQPVFGHNLPNTVPNKPNGVVYADLDMPTTNSIQSSFDLSSSKPKSQKSKPKTEYATLKFNEVGQEIDV